MNEALAGLIGAVIGSLITLIVTYMNNNKDYKLKLLDYDVKKQENISKENKRQRDQRIERYAEFLGAYRIVDGSFINIIQIIENNHGCWSDKINEIIDSKEFSDSILKLNEGAAWIKLMSICEETGIILNKLNTAHDSMANELFVARHAAEDGKPIDIIKLKSYIEKVETVFEDLSKSLRNEIAI
jgi:hypothetical protein